MLSSRYHAAIFGLVFLTLTVPSAQGKSIYANFGQESDGSETLIDGESVDFAVRSAIAHNPNIESAAALVRAASADRLQAVGAFLPSVEATATYTDEAWRNGSQNTLNANDGFTLGISVRQPIFQGLSNINRLREANSLLDQSKYSQDGAIEQIAFTAAQAHAAVIRARQISSHRRKNLALVKKQFEITEARMKAGAQSRTGVEQARMRMAQAEGALEESLAVLAASESAYSRIVGHEPPFTMHSDDDEETLSFDTMDDALSAALANNPQLNAARKSVSAARYAKLAARGAWGPNVSLEGNFFKNPSTELNTIEEDEFQIIARARVPIFAQGTNHAALRRASSQVMGQHAQLRDTRLFIEETISRSWQQLVTSRARTEAALKSSKAAERSVEGLQIEYEAGRRTVIDVLDGQRDLVDTEISLSQAQFDLRVSRYELAATAGLLSSAFALDEQTTLSDQ